MSKLLEENSPFLQLLLTTTPAQSLNLLNNITPSQALCISEICLNLLTLPLSQKETKIVKKNKELLKKLSKKKAAFISKSKFISKKRKDIYKLLILFKDPLLQLI